MTRKWLVVALVLAVTPGLALAQEKPGAQRIEIGSAIFGGGLMWVPSANASAGMSRSYMLSGAFTNNVNHWIGIEGDVGVALGRHGAHDIYGVTSNHRTPNVLMYSGNVIYNPFASNRPLVPYVSAGLGGVTTFAAAEATDYGLPAETTYLMGSAGGGVRWFPIWHYGVRVDYRYMAIKNDVAPAGGTRLVRSAHRVYGALVLTF